MSEGTKKELSVKNYIVGFSLSIFLTILAFGLTYVHINSIHETISHEVLIPALICLALFQLVVQLVFFLHLGRRDSNTRLNLLFFVSTFGLVLLVVIASLWIMGHLNYNMTPQTTTDYIIQDEGIHHH